MAAKKVLFIEGISGNLKNQFKAACAKRGMSMKQVVEQLMAEFIHKENNRPVGQRKR